MGKIAPLARLVVAVAVGSLIYWVLETAAFGANVMQVVQIAVWLSPISILGWLAADALIAAAYSLTGKSPGPRQ